MTRSRVGITLLAVMALVLVATPVLAADPVPGSGSADISVMNTENTSGASVSVEYYNLDGSLASTSVPKVLNAYGSAQFLATDSGLAANWKGSAIVSSTTDVAAVATIRWSAKPVGDGVEADSYSGFTSGARRMNLPYLVYAPNAQFSSFSVQNTAGTIANITMKYYNRAGVLDFTIGDTIPAGGQNTYDLHTPGVKIPVWTNSSFFNTNNQWTGAVIVETAADDQQIAAIQNNFWPQYSASYSASSGTGSTRLFVPSAARRFDPADTARGLELSIITVQNLGAGPTDVTFKFINKDTGVIDQTITYTGLVAGAAIGCNTRIGADCDAAKVAALGTSWVGSVIVESSAEPVASVSISNRTRDNEAGAVTAVSSANAGLATFLPEAYRRLPGPSGNQWSLLRIQNVSSSDAVDVVVKFMNPDGTEVVAARQTVTIPGEKVRNFNLRYDAFSTALGTNWTGGVFISSPQPLAAVVENLWSLQELAAYNGYSK
jgi:hypothetical protein